MPLRIRRVNEKLQKRKAMDAEIAKSIARVMVARARILEYAEGTGEMSGSTQCPVCETGKLRFSIASCNGHVHASCNTPGCVRWME